MTLSEKILKYCVERLGRTEGDGECWTLAENAVVNSGGKSSKSQTPNFGTTSNYVWGTVKQIADAKGGYILQFRNYNWESSSTIDVTFADGSGSVDTSSKSESRPHHTAIFSNVVYISIKGVAVPTPLVEVIEQNAPVGSNVHKTILCLKSIPKKTVTTKEQRKDSSGKLQTATVKTTTEHKVTGTIWIYEAKI